MHESKIVLSPVVLKNYSYHSSLLLITPLSRAARVVLGTTSQINSKKGGCSNGP
jgi:hypothetical protein